MGVMALRKTFPHLQRCDLCKSTTKHLYVVDIGGMQYKFCSGAHAQQAHQNFNQNKSLGVTPSSPQGLPEDLLDEGGDGID